MQTVSAPAMSGKQNMRKVTGGAVEWPPHVAGKMLNTLTTNPSIFIRLKAADAAPREFAWKEFHERYAPIIAGFAQRLGARKPDLDDILQDVMLGFFSKSPTFVYDPA